MRKMNIVGPIKKNGVEESLQYLKIILKRENISSIFINRYAQDILLELSDDILKKQKNIKIGNNVMFGQNVLLFDHDHDYKKNIIDKLFFLVIIKA